VSNVLNVVVAEPGPDGSGSRDRPLRRSAEYVISVNIGARYPDGVLPPDEGAWPEGNLPTGDLTVQVVLHMDGWTVPQAASMIVPGPGGSRENGCPAPCRQCQCRHEVWARFRAVTPANIRQWTGTLTISYDGVVVLAAQLVLPIGPGALGVPLARLLHRLATSFLASGPADPSPPERPDAGAIGRSLLLVRAQASGAEETRWVHRRVQQVEFLDVQAVRWRMSLDFDVPFAAPLVDSYGRPFRLVPLTTLPKGQLVTVDFRDERQAAIPLLTAKKANHYLCAGMCEWAKSILRGQSLPAEIRDRLRKIVKRPPDGHVAEMELFAAAVSVLDGRPVRTESDFIVPSRGQDILAAEPGDLADAAKRLMCNEFFRSQLFELAKDFMVIATVADDPGTRRILKLAFDGKLPFKPPHNLINRISREMGWASWQFMLTLGGEGYSDHLAVAAPPGVDISKITAQRKVPGSSASTYSTPGEIPHVPIRVPTDADRYEATIFARVIAPAWLTPSLLVALAISGALFYGWTLLTTLFKKSEPTDAQTAATLLLTFLGLVAVLLIRPSEHPLAARMLRWPRALIFADVGIVLVCAGDLALHVSGHTPTVLWEALLAASGLILILIFWSWFRLLVGDRAKAVDAPLDDVDALAEGG
jgi:hypothetical protein